ncbi:unnamed protein product [Adineta ricciae]|uniref:Neurexin/syndecan/glycophorin C domain-containing protein n=1 Tax=Adineta ricciae TaxID=249248 RepID=A0A814U7E9_ADIRI|nr:unnamed protein product [Adineta ricciae]
MIGISILIFAISMKTVVTTNNSALNRSLVFSVCHQDGPGLQTILKSIDRPSYFYFTSQSSSTLSSFSSSIHLSFCEHQHTTYYLPSGFSILRSSPRLPLVDIAAKEDSSSYHNTILNATDQSTSTTNNMITTVMPLPSSTPSLQEKHLVIDMNNNLHLTTTTTTLSNSSFPYTSLATTIQHGQRTFYVMLLSGCGAAGLLILITIYTIIKYYNRDEGSYKIDESKNFSPENHLERLNDSGCGGKIPTVKQHRQKLLAVNEQTRANTKEWYV